MNYDPHPLKGSFNAMHLHTAYFTLCTVLFLLLAPCTLPLATSQVVSSLKADSINTQKIRVTSGTPTIGQILSAADVNGNLTWSTITTGVATPTVNGLMSSTDKGRLDTLFYDACGGKDTVMDVDINWYSIKSYGSAGCWMTQNLRTYSNRDSAGKLSTDAGVGRIGPRINPGYYSQVNGPVVMASAAAIKSTTDVSTSIFKGSVVTMRMDDFTREFGVLYTWYQAMNSATPAPQETFTTGAGTVTSTIRGICPVGWVLPSDKDLNMLEKEIVNNPLYGGAPGAWNTAWESVSAAYRGNRHGMAMKWDNQVYGDRTVASNRYSWGGTNTSGFNVLPVGIVSTDNIAFNFGFGPSFWSSSAYNTSAAWSRFIYNVSTGVGRNYDPKAAYFSIRCKKQ